MAHRPQNVQPPVGSASRGSRDNTIESQTLHPVSQVAPAPDDPSPFSRQELQQATLSRHERIALAAYRRAEARGFAPGNEVEDWLGAEREVDAGAPPG